MTKAFKAAKSPAFWEAKLQGLDGRYHVVAQAQSARRSSRELSDGCSARRCRYDPTSASGWTVGSLRPSKEGKGLIERWLLGKDLTDLPRPSPKGITKSGRRERLRLQ